MTAGRHRILALAGVALVVGLTLTGELKALLEATHLDGRASGSLDSLVANPLSRRGPDARRAARIVAGWRQFHDQLGNERRDFVSGLTTARTSLRIDALVVTPAIGVVVGLLLRRARRYTDDRPDIDSDPSWRALRAVLFQPAVTAAALCIPVAGWVHAAATMGVVKHAWRGVRLDGEQRLAGRLQFGCGARGVVQRACDVINSGAATLPDRNGLILQQRLDDLRVSYGLAYGASVLKWLLLAGVLLPLGVLAIRILRDGRMRELLASWPTIVLVTLLGAALRVDQSVDAVRRWGVTQALLTTLVVGLAAVSVSVATGRVFTFRPRRTDNKRHEQDRPTADRAPRPPRWFDTGLRSLGRLWPLLAGAAVSAAIALVAPGFWIPAGALLGIALLSAPIEHIWPEAGSESIPESPSGTSPRLRNLGALLGAAMVVAVGRTAIAAGAGDLFYRQSDSRVAALGTGQAAAVGYGIAAAVSAVFLYEALRSLNERIVMAQSRRLHIALGVAVLLPTLVCVVLLAAPGPSYVLAPEFGAIAVAIAFIAAVGLVLVALRVLVDLGQWTPWTRRWTNPAVLRVMRFRRPPVVGAIVAWAMLAGSVDNGGFHDVRHVDAGVPKPLTIGQAFARWRAHLPPIPPGVKEPNDSMVVVAASGGGIRAAYWTSMVLDCLVERDAGPTGPCEQPADPTDITRRRAHLFLLSGISGSSLGLVAWERHADIGEQPEVNGQPWFEHHLNDDFLAPTLARMLFVDGINVLARVRRTGGDRAAALEVAWERAWGSDRPLAQPFLAEQNDADGRFLLLNGYSAKDGCRVLVSALETNGGRPGSHCGLVDNMPLAETADGGSGGPALARTALDATTDIGDLACKDVAWSTAALLSARFPYVSPSGRLMCRGRADAPRAYVLDGGYRDTSAASTIVELWPHVSAQLDRANDELAQRGGCIVPFFLQIDNDYTVASVTGPDSAPNEALLVPQALNRTKDGIAKAARIAAQRVFTGPIDHEGTEVSFLYRRGNDFDPVGPRWLRIHPRAHPGSAAPLGWVLSKAARSDLTRQLTLNTDAIVRARAWLDADQDSMRCFRNGS